MASNLINDIVEVITTLGFILLFVLPFLGKKKKKQAEVDESSSNQPETTKPGTTSWEIEEALAEVFNPQPKPAARPRPERKSIGTITNLDHDKPSSRTADSLPVDPSPAMALPPERSVNRRHPWLANASDLRRAIIMKEILDPPKGLQ